MNSRRTTAPFYGDDSSDEDARPATQTRASATPKRRRTAKLYPTAEGEEDDVDRPAWMATFNVANYECLHIKVMADGGRKRALVYVPDDPTLPTLHQLLSTFVIICCVEKSVAGTAIYNILRDFQHIKKVTLPRIFL